MDTETLDMLGEIYNSAGGPVQVALIVVGFAIAIVAVVSFAVSIYLSISYIKFNRRENSAGLTGEEAARKVLDLNGLEHISVKVSGSLLFGNSYSHYFKKVRLRRRTVSKKSLASLAMGTEKAALAVLDKEGDPDMRKRVKMVPIIAIGPFAFIPLVLVGAVIDILLMDSDGICTIVLSCMGAAFYIFSFILSLLTLKTEKKAQERSYTLLRENGMATEDEISDMQRLFRLYNIEYINDMVLSMLEVLYYILQLVAASKKSPSVFPSK